ncbi:MAG: hypothetical protein ABSE07_02250 [Methanoregula sp.]|jgi:hypothetical protein
MTIANGINRAVDDDGHVLYAVTTGEEENPWLTVLLLEENTSVPITPRRIRVAFTGIMSLITQIEPLTPDEDALAGHLLSLNLSKMKLHDGDVKKFAKATNMTVDRVQIAFDGLWEKEQIGTIEKPIVTRMVDEKKYEGR